MILQKVNLNHYILKINNAINNEAIKSENGL